MKSLRSFLPVALALAVVLVPSSTAFAGRHYYSSNRSSCGSVTVARGNYYGGRRCYPAYRPYGWYRPWYRPAFSFTYVRPAYYGGARSAYYRSAPGYYEGRSVEVQVQIALAKKGYYHGPIDGDIGPGSRAAIRAYQVDRGLRASGRIDGDLIDELDV